MYIFVQGSRWNITLRSPLVPRLCLLVFIGGSQQTAKVHHGNVVRRFELHSLLVVSGCQLPVSCAAGEGKEEAEEAAGLRKRIGDEWERQRNQTGIRIE